MYAFCDTLTEQRVDWLCQGRRYTEVPGYTQSAEFDSLPVSLHCSGSQLNRLLISYGHESQIKKDTDRPSVLAWEINPIVYVKCRHTSQPSLGILGGSVWAVAWSVCTVIIRVQGQATV